MSRTNSWSIVIPIYPLRQQHSLRAAPPIPAQGCLFNGFMHGGGYIHLVVKVAEPIQLFFFFFLNLKIDSYSS